MSDDDIMDTLFDRILNEQEELEKQFKCIQYKDKDCDTFEVMRHKLFWDLCDNLPKIKSGSSDEL